MLSLQTAAGNNTAQHLFGSYADELAARNWAANLRALSVTQPRVVADVQSRPAGVTWVFGRDGALTAHIGDGQWLSNCSVPLAAARSMLRKLDVSGVTACFLRPDHAAQLVAAMEKILAEQGLIAVVPDERSLRLMLACADFSDAIDAGRLWFAHGERWSERLDELFTEKTGLPTPSQFVRTPLLDETATQELIAQAQPVIARHNAARSEQIQRLSTRTRPNASVRTRWCVIGASRFRLWQDAGAILHDVIGNGTADGARFDPGDPASSSPLELATLIDRSDAVVAANMARADLPTVAPVGVPWITWVTSGHIPHRLEGADADGVILADARWRPLAEQNGWAPDRIAVGGWPALPATENALPVVALIADTCALTTPSGEVLPLSSHRLLWEHIRAEIEADPFVIGAAGGLDAYLSERLRNLSISRDTLDVARFVGRLIVPAFQQSIARVLRDAAVPLHIHGDGWPSLDEFRPVSRGSIRTRTELRAAISRCAALIHPSPTDDAHPIDGVPRLLIRAAGMRRESLIFCAQSAIKDLPTATATRTPPIDGKMIRELLAR